MEVNRYIRKDRVNKKGYAPIRMAVLLNGERFYLVPDERCKPEHWLDDSQKMDGNAPYANVINSKLHNWETLLFDIFHEYRKENEPLTAEILKREFEARRPKPAVEPEPVAPLLIDLASDQEGEEDNATPFFKLFGQWRDFIKKKRQKGTGRKISPNTIKSINATINRFQEFEAYRKKPIDLKSFDKEFYNEFEDYVMDHLKQAINTFGKHIDKLKSFLKWCEEEHDLDVNKKYRRYEAPEIYVGVDALNARELERVYKLNFQDPGIREQVVELYDPRGNRAPTPGLIEERLRDLELARDIFLFCCYTGLRISDVIKLSYKEVKGEVIVIAATKTLNECHIPFYDDMLFKPVEILEKYEGLQKTCLPNCPKINKLLKTIQELANVRRINLSTKIGRKTFVTLKVYQGVPARLIMQATGHKTESSFNRYAGLDTNELVQEFKRQSAKLNTRMGSEVGAIS